MDSNSAIYWLRKIFNIQTLATIIGIVGGCIGVLEYVENNEGTVVALVNNKESSSPTERNVLVYLDQETLDLKQLNLLPQILNPSKYTVKDIYVKYAIKSNNANIDYTDYYTIHRVADKTELDIKDKTLYAQTELPEAFNAIILKNNSSIEISMRTTYQGAEQPYEYEARIAAKKIWHNNDAQRKQRILADAYQYASNKALNFVDIYIMKGEFANIMTNVSIQQLQAFNTVDTQQTSPQVQTPAKTESQAKSVSTIRKESKDTIQNIKNESSTPWYVWLIGIILFLILFVAGVGMMFGFMVAFDKTKPQNNRVRAFLTGFVALIIVYLCEYFFFICINNTEPWKFIAGFLCSLICVIGGGLSIYLTEMIKNKFHIKEGSFAEDLAFAITFIVISPIFYFLIAYLYEVIPI